MKGNLVLRVRRELCLGCGACVESCPQQAISIVSATAVINQSRCHQCRLCLDICPQGAIIEFTPVSAAELATMVGSLKQKTDYLMERIEQLRWQGIKQTRGGYYGK